MCGRIALRSQAQWDHLASLVRAGDRDRYLATLFAPRPKRHALLALYAFNLELARVPEAVSEPMLGDIRLQWWRDALATVGEGEATGHPVADALGQAAREHGLPRPALLGLIDARAFDLSDAAMPDLAALKAYLSKTSGALFALSAHVLVGRPLQPDRPARQAGIAYGLTGLMRMAPIHRARGRRYLPGAADASAEGAAAFAPFRAEAERALAEARSGLAHVPAEAQPAFLPLALVEPYLAVLARPGADPLRQPAEITPLRRLWCLTRAGLRGRV